MRFRNSFSILCEHIAKLTATELFLIFINWECGVFSACWLFKFGYNFWILEIMICSLCFPIGFMCGKLLRK